jgi:hypothetical protein
MHATTRWSALLSSTHRQLSQLQHPTEIFEAMHFKSIISVTALAVLATIPSTYANPVAVAEAESNLKVRNLQSSVDALTDLFEKRVSRCTDYDAPITQWTAEFLTSPNEGYSILLRLRLSGMLHVWRTRLRQLLFPDEPEPKPVLCWAAGSGVSVFRASWRAHLLKGRYSEGIRLDVGA